jgi:stearoyl-CoA desaturase (delta-9 desaturase)
MIWVPLNAAGIINGIGHYWGYRNFETEDGSTNITNFGFIIGGEELHNNHHAYPSSAKFSSKWWEIDIGWFYIKLLSLFGLAKVRRRAPQPMRLLNKSIIDLETAKAMVTSKLHVMAEYAQQVTLPTFHAELPNFEERYKRLVNQMRTALVREDSRMKPLQHKQLQELLQNSEALHTVYEMRRKLQDLWNETHASHERMIQAIIEWCKEAEATGIKALEDFAQSLRGYALQSAV